MRRLLSQYYMPAQNDQYQKHPTPFVAYLFNQTGESGDVHTI